jgi:hypothetical protein
MKPPRLFSLDASKGAVCKVLLRKAVFDHVSSELAILARQYPDTVDRLASRPQAKIPQAVPRQILSSDANRES